MLNYGVRLPYNLICFHCIQINYLSKIVYMKLLCTQVRRTVEFAGKPLRIRRSRKQCDRYWSQIVFLCQITEKRSDESWNWSVEGSIPGALSPVLENFRRPLFQTWLTAPGSPRIRPFQNGPIATKFLPQQTCTVLNLLFHWSPLICTSIVFRDRGTVM